MTKYTLAEHSGLGPSALEAYHISSASMERQVRAAGGVVLDSYSQASALEHVMVRYIGNGICPAGVVGSFSPVRIHQMALWVPDAWATTLLKLADECGWSTPLAQLAVATDGIMAAPATA